MAAADAARESVEAPVDAKPRWELRKHGVSSGEQLEALDAREMMVRYLEVEDRDWIQPARGADAPSRSAAPSSDTVYADPGAAARALFDAMEAGRWSDVAPFVDDATAEKFKDRVLGAVHEEEELRERELAVRPSNGREAPTLGAPYLCAWYAVESIEADARSHPALVVARSPC